MQANNRNPHRNKHCQNRNIFKSEDVISCDEVSNYPISMLRENLTPVKSKKWKLVFCLKSFSGGQTASTIYQRHCQMLQAQYYQGETWCTIWAIQLRFFLCLISKAKVSVLPISSTIIHLGGGWSFKWPPCKPVQMPTSLLNSWSSHKQPLSDNTSTWAMLEHSSVSSVPHTSKIFCCPNKSLHHQATQRHHSQHADY